MTKKINVGLVGYGYASKTFHAPLLVGTPDIELVAVFSGDANKVNADLPFVNVVSDPKKLFDDPSIDLIVIATPNDTHFELAKQALVAGKHVVVDKPFTVTLSEAQQLKQKADEVKRLLSVFHNRRWDSDFLTLKALLDEGALGEVVYFESHIDRYRPVVRQRWREQAVAGSGIWYDLGPHLLDQIIQLFGMPETLYVDLGELRPESLAVDYFHATLGYTGRRVVLHSTMLAAAETARFIVHGINGSYIKYGLDMQETRLKAGERLPQPDWGHDMNDGILTLSRDEALSERRLSTLNGNYPAYYIAIRDAINGKGENPVTAAEAVQVMALIELGLDSAQQKRTLSVKTLI